MCRFFFLKSASSNANGSRTFTSACVSICLCQPQGKPYCLAQKQSPLQQYLPACKRCATHRFWPRLFHYNSALPQNGSLKLFSQSTVSCLLASWAAHAHGSCGNLNQNYCIAVHAAVGIVIACMHTHGLSAEIAEKPLNAEGLALLKTSHNLQLYHTQPLPILPACTALHAMQLLAASLIGGLAIQPLTFLTTTNCLSLSPQPHLNLMPPLFQK